MHPGDVVAGKYRVAAILGRTGGLLLEARHTEFDQRVVIRMLSPHVCDEKELERFRREARTLAKLESEHVARIIDVGTHSDGSFYLVRQHLDGVDLATHIKNQGALTLDEAVLIVLQAGEALQECHSHNILLREVQPAHLFLTTRRGGMPMAKIIDFGTAKLLKDPGMSEGALGELTATVMFGMSQYSSPELVRKQQGIDGRTDVWSLGCILYELLAAVPAFSGEMAELMLKITREDPIPLSQLRPDIPQEFDQIISWALAKDKESRFSSVYAMAHALKPFASAEGQVLVDRIGRLAHTKDGPTIGMSGPNISPTSPLAKRSGSSYDEPDDEATVMRHAPGYEPESEFEQTAFLPDAEDFGRGSVPPPDRGSVPPPPGSRPELSGSWSALAIDPDPLGSPYSASTTTGAYPAMSPVGREQQKRQRKAAVIAFAASLVMLPVLVMVLVFALRDGSPDGAVAQNDPTPPAGDTRVAGSDGDTDQDDDEAPAAASATGSASAAASGGDSDFAAPPKPTGKWPPPAPQPPRVGGDRLPPPPPPPPPPARKKKKKKKKKSSDSESGGTGTLVAIAIGGSCSFAVDGAPKGKKSSIRVKVSVGPHTVSCSPPGKATRTQRVNVKAGKPGIASFRL